MAKSLDRRFVTPHSVQIRTRVLGYGRYANPTPANVLAVASIVASGTVLLALGSLWVVGPSSVSGCGPRSAHRERSGVSEMRVRAWREWWSGRGVVGAFGEAWAVGRSRRRPQLAVRDRGVGRSWPCEAAASAALGARPRAVGSLEASEAAGRARPGSVWCEAWGKYFRCGPEKRQARPQAIRFRAISVRRVFAACMVSDQRPAAVRLRSFTATTSRHSLGATTSRE
jgi:hypothetical protein